MDYFPERRVTDVQSVHRLVIGAKCITQNACSHCGLLCKKLVICFTLRWCHVYINCYM